MRWDGVRSIRDLFVHAHWTTGSPSYGGCVDRAASLVALQSTSVVVVVAVCLCHTRLSRRGTDAVHGRDGSQLTGLGFRWWE